MAIIPFGLVGAFFGHIHWDVTLSMFSIVGLIGMTGIIINDSIVLVTTIDEYAKDRGLFPAIIDGVCDRLRAVLLTTLTTVLGLAPLLYEQSTQAQFLKPTVITLVYGLGFGMILVLVVVPAIVAMQTDIGRQFAAMKRILPARKRSALVTLTTLGTFIFCAILFAFTLGAVGILGKLPAIWANIVPVNASEAANALFIFLFGSAVITLSAYCLSAVWFALKSHGSTTSQKKAASP